MLGPVVGVGRGVGAVSSASQARMERVTARTKSISFDVLLINNSTTDGVEKLRVVGYPI